MPALYPYLIGVAGIAAMMAMWVVVQLAWRRTFPEACGDPDALAARSGCGSCAHDSDCNRQPDDITSHAKAECVDHATR